MAKLVKLGKYELIKRLAVGGMSEIYLASQGGLHGFERAVVVKCIREDLDTDREVLDMFLDEARIAACLKHPNIVHLYDVGESYNIPYLAMEYIFGRDLLQIGDRARQLGWELPLQFLLKVFCDALAGLHYAHFVAEYEDRPLNVVHRDISPQNIIVSFDGITKVLDFGIAKAASRLSKTQAGILKGKYAFMSPEQVRGKDLSHQSDQFSLAVVLYETLSQTRLFLRDTDYATMEAVDACEIPPLKVLRKDTPRRLVRVLRKAMRHRASRRFATCGEMERALDKMLKGSAVDQTELVAKFMRKLFASELQIRDQAIEAASDQERELLLSTGFEMVRTRPSAIPRVDPVPLAQERYEQILAEKQGEKTVLHAQPLTEKKAGVLDESTQPDSLRKKPGAKKNLLYDWRFLLVVFLGVLLLAFLLLLKLGGGSETPPPKEGAGGLEAYRSTFHPGEDGFLSVSVRPSVRVYVDGADLGVGAFRKQPLSKGSHQVILKDLQGKGRESFSVFVEADKEFLLAPERWQ